MIVTFVHVWVKNEYIEAFLKATISNHKESVKEPGNLRFDILQDDNDPGKFVLYEAYDSDESAAAHKTTKHYLAWRTAVADMMARPRQGIKHKIIYPVDQLLW
ncbi:MAG: antibiotic biosynthesis monooxygenase [Bacteroidales bacterium]|nr:antibiotic biosynthesis monooxygenase [Bacteroidales bacterium]